MLVEVDGLPSWYRSLRFRGMGSRNGGWLCVVGCFKLCLMSGVGDVSYLWEVKY